MDAKSLKKIERNLDHILIKLENEPRFKGKKDIIKDIKKLKNDINKHTKYTNQKANNNYLKILKKIKNV